MSNDDELENIMEAKNKDSLAILTATTDQRWQAVKDLIREYDIEFLADIHDKLMMREDEFSDDGPRPDDEELIIAICAMVGMCRIVEEIWREDYS